MRGRRIRIGIVIGTRPEIIKLSSILRRLQRERAPYVLVHTGQHYSYRMDRIFFEGLRLPKPHHHIDLPTSGLAGHGDQTAYMMERISGVFLRQRPDVLIVQGDTNSVLAGSLVAVKMGIPVAHVEAGLRSYDRRMPEEINRIVSDHLSSYLFAPTRTARSTLIAEGVDRRRIHVTGNTIVDAVRECAALAHPDPPKRPYMLMTLHRQENVDDRRVLRSILEGLRRVQRRFGVEIVFPIHPRTALRLSQMKLSLPEGVRMIEPVGFMEFIGLQKNAQLVLTDSGGLQEESCILGVPCVTLRSSTERPETVSVGANRVAGHAPEAILRAAEDMVVSRKNWKNPFGDGRSGERIIRILQRSVR